MNETNDPFVDQLTLTERELLSLDQTIIYRYRCSRCWYEDEVPNVVLMGFVASGGRKPGQMPRLVCPKYG